MKKMIKNTSNDRPIFFWKKSFSIWVPYKEDLTEYKGYKTCVEDKDVIHWLLTGKAEVVDNIEPATPPEFPEIFEYKGVGHYVSINEEESFFIDFKNQINCGGFSFQYNSLLECPFKRLKGFEKQEFLQKTFSISLKDYLKVK